MKLESYQDPRPSIPAAIRRAVEVESGHACAVNRCGEHTYLEIHHINEDREDNQIQNLVLLCDKHHKMAHAGVIDRKALYEYKSLLKSSYNKTLTERVERLEGLMAQSPAIESGPIEQSPTTEDPDLPVKVVGSRVQMMAFMVEQLAITKYERDCHLHLERNPRFSKGRALMELDALYQNYDLPEDLIVEVRWVRKLYLVTPVLVQQMEAKVSLYELITGRKAHGLLILVVPDTSTKRASELTLLAKSAELSGANLEIITYSYEELSFDPGPVSAGII